MLMGTDNDPKGPGPQSQPVAAPEVSSEMARAGGRAPTPASLSQAISALAEAEQSGTLTGDQLQRARSSLNSAFSELERTTGTPSSTPAVAPGSTPSEPAPAWPPPHDEQPDAEDELDQQWEQLELEGGQAREKDIELTRALLSLLRTLRARAGRATKGDEALVELHKGLAKYLDEHGEVVLRVSVDGLYMGERPVLKVSPMEDPALFRVFQHGIRQLAFFPGLELEELEDFISVLTTELSFAESVEEDISTILADKELINIHFVVVETFTEGSDEQGRKRAADVADVVAAALREQLSGELESAQGSGGAVRFWSADVAFVQENNLKELVDALPTGQSAAVLGQSGDEDLAAFNEHLNGALARWTPWLPKAVLSLLDGATPQESDMIYPLLRTQILADARSYGLAAMLPQIDEIAAWVKEHEGQPQTFRLLEEVFTAGLRALAIRDLRLRDPDAHTAARLVFSHLPVNARFSTLNEVLLMPPSSVKRKAIKALMEGVGMAISELTEIIADMEYEAAWTIIDHCREYPVNEDLLGLHYAATKHNEPKVRALSLRWLALRGGDRSTNAYRNALNDSDETVHAAALYLLAATKNPNGPKFVYDWFYSPVFKKAEMKDKRLGAQMLAHFLGQHVAPELRKLLNKKNVMGNRNVDEMRAAAAVALIMLNDKDTEKKLPKLASSRFSGQALKTEIKGVLAAKEAGRTPYPSPFATLNNLALNLRLIERSTGGVTSKPPAAGDARRGGRSLTPPVRNPAEAKNASVPPGAVENAKDADSQEGKLPDKVAKEILESFSFDDLPLTGADAD